MISKQATVGAFSNTPIPKSKNFKSLKPKSLDITIIADYNDDLAFNEVISNFQKNDPAQLFTYRILNIPPFNTLATGFVISQLALHGQHENLVIMSNTAPRTNKHINIPWHGHEDQPFLLSLIPLANSDKKFIPVFFVHSGFAGSFLKDKSIGFWKVNITNRGTQFRSRDIYAQAVTDYIYNKNDIIGEKIDPQTIPDIPANHIAWIDGYGNIKTTTRKSQWPDDLKDKQEINITISNGNNIMHSSPVQNRISIKGSHEDGKTYIQPGSSGGSENPLLEIITVMGSAAKKFQLPKNYKDNLTISLSAK